MAKCDFCSQDIQLPFICPYCSGRYCSEHRLPENHHCQKLPTEPKFWYQKRSQPHSKYVPRYKSPNLRSSGKMKSRRPGRIRKKAKAIVVLFVSLIVVGIFILSWAGFFAQLIMPSFVDTAQIETEILELINMERANRGLPTLLVDKALATIASEWSNHLAVTGELTHGDFESRIAMIGYSHYQCGEIIAMHGGWASALGRTFVDMWLGSSGHYEIMMTPLSGYMGVGVSKVGSNFFAVVDFRFT